MTSAVLLTMVFGAALAQTPDPSSSAQSAVTKHINALHSSLKITAAEESQWSTVAATMRANASDLDGAINKRSANAGNATAIDDLNSYADIAQAHADGIKKLATAFSALYAAMPDEQKKVADQVFSQRHENGKIARR
jgi:hypothetical protein